MDTWLIAAVIYVAVALLYGGVGAALFAAAAGREKFYSGLEMLDEASEEDSEEQRHARLEDFKVNVVYSQLAFEDVLEHHMNAAIYWPLLVVALVVHVVLTVASIVLRIPMVGAAWLTSRRYEREIARQLEANRPEKPLRQRRFDD